jgi:hypothetical protein
MRLSLPLYVVRQYEPKRKRARKRAWYLIECNLRRLKHAGIGRYTDAVVARRLGVKGSAVNCARLRLGIPKSGYRGRHTNWQKFIDAGVGKLPDAEVAAKLGLSRERVRQIRDGLGLKKFDWAERRLEKRERQKTRIKEAYPRCKSMLALAKESEVPVGDVLRELLDELGLAHPQGHSVAWGNTKYPNELILSAIEQTRIYEEAGKLLGFKNAPSVRVSSLILRRGLHEQVAVIRAGRGDRRFKNGLWYPKDRKNSPEKGRVSAVKIADDAVTPVPADTT